jgi:adenylate kinase
MRIVLLGPPGSGKGTQAKLLEKRFGTPQVSTGEIFRKAVAAKTELGGRVSKFLDAGALVPDDLTIELVRERLAGKDVEAGFVLDGFPRTVPQAVGVEEILREHGWELDAVVDIKIDIDVLVPRLALRRTCPSCGTVYHMEHVPPGRDGRCTSCGAELVSRADDNAETVKKRIAVYFAQTAELVDYYKKRSKLVEVDGRGDVNQVFGEILAALEARGKAAGKSA